MYFMGLVMTNIVHGAAHQLAVFVPLAEMHGQRHFGEFGTHAQQSRAPHPEHRTDPLTRRKMQDVSSGLHFPADTEVSFPDVLLLLS